MKETFAAARSLLTGPAPTLFGSRNRPKAKSNFWVTFIDLLPVVMSAGAILVDPSGRADLGGFPGAVNRLMVPFEVLTVEKDALEFLRQFVPLREKEDPEQEVRERYRYSRARRSVRSTISRRNVDE